MPRAVVVLVLLAMVDLLFTSLRRFVEKRLDPAPTVVALFDKAETTKLAD